MLSHRRLNIAAHRRLSILACTLFCRCLHTLSHRRWYISARRRFCIRFCRWWSILLHSLLSILACIQCRKLESKLAAARICILVLRTKKTRRLLTRKLGLLGQALTRSRALQAKKWLNDGVLLMDVFTRLRSMM